MPDPGTGPSDALAISPACGGSKRIPRKSVRSFDGLPLLVPTICTLRDSGQLRHVGVSTEDDETAAIATDAGASVPFRRPDELADDHAPTATVIAHALQHTGELLGDRSEHVCVAYPASVVIDVKGIRVARALLLVAGTDYAFVARTFSAPIKRALRRRVDDRAEVLRRELCDMRWQDLEKQAHDGGHLCLAASEVWATQRPALGEDSSVHVPTCWRVQP